MIETKRLSATECKAKAKECRDVARAATKKEHRVMLEHMADTWERIAADVSDSEPRIH